jgi:drug/metabolite transporter (DMT)-like permease
MIKNLQGTNYFLMLALGATLIGFAPIFVKWSELSPAAITFWRMLLALPLLICFNYAINKKIFFRVKNKKTIFYTALASLAFTTDLTLWHYSMNITSVANATIIVNSAPIFVALLAFIFYKELPAKGFGKSFLITYVGIIGLIIFSNNYANGKIFGDLLCMIAAIFYAVYLLIISKLNKETSLNIIFYTTFFCCLFSLMPIMINSKSFIPISNFEWINMLLMAFLCQFGGQFLITFGIGKISASTGSIGLLMQPLTATLLAALIFTEILNLIQIVFVFITLVGIYLARLSIVK